MAVTRILKEVLPHPSTPDPGELDDDAPYEGDFAEDYDENESPPP
jgi:hypothetical protein